jgi:phage terminase large subunit
MSEVRVIDYEEESFLRFDEWAKRLKDKPYNYGEHWLPHDGANSLQAAGGQSAQKILTPLLRQQPKIIPRPPSVEVPIRAARMLFPRIYVDEAKCARLMDCLKRFRRGVPEATGEPGAPVKDEYRHGADAFGGLALIVDKISNDNIVLPQVPVFGPSDAEVGM